MKAPSSLTGPILTPGGTIPHGTIHWDSSGRITRIETHGVPIPHDSEAAGRLICPGFINLHVHGGLGADTLDADPAALETIAGDQARQGVTAFLPTAASASRGTLEAVCSAVRGYRAGRKPGDPGGAEILGLHLEGPYFNPARAGAQNPAHFRDPDWDEFEALRLASGEAIRLVSLAPERDPGGGFIRKAVAAGVRVAAGHTNADYGTMRRALAQGIAHATHVFNAMPGLHHRNPTGLNALLEDDRVHLELIPDCTEIPHVHPAAIRLLKRLVGPDRICTVTDAVSAAGCPDGAYRLGDLPIRKAGEMVFLESSPAERGEGRLAGSVLAMNAGIRNLVEKCGFSLEEAVRTAAANPARAIGIESDKGSLVPGRHADLVVLRPETFEVVATYVRGVKVFGNG
jgi:N-acetylglucosamine-6-phosphate deacetylase